MTIVDFMMEKLYPGEVLIYSQEHLQRDRMRDLVGKVIRDSFDVVELATDSWSKERTEEFLDMISDVLGAVPDLVSWYKEWNERRLECEADDMEADNRRDSSFTGTSIKGLK